MKPFRFTAPENISTAFVCAVLSTTCNIFLLLIITLDGTKFVHLFTMLAVFVGAFLAFLFQLFMEGRKQKVNDRAAIETVNFIILDRLNWLKSNIDVFDQFRNANKRHEQIPETRVTPPEMRIPIEKLQYILRTDDPQFLMDLSIHDRNFFAFISAIRDRNEVRRKIFNDHLITSQQGAQFTLTVPKFVEIEYVHATDIVFDLLDANLERLRELERKIRSHIKQNFPDGPDPLGDGSETTPPKPDTPEQD